VFYVFHGENELDRAEELAKLRGQLAGGDAAMADLNTTVLDGKGLTLGELRHACDTIPFMADKRLVIVHGLLGRLAPAQRAQGTGPSKGNEAKRKEAYLADLEAYLPLLPPKTRLVFVESKTLSATHPILKLVAAEGQEIGGFSKLFKLPRQEDLPRWILKRTQAKGAAISSEAAATLAELVGDDLRLLDLEIDKLAIYADGRQITSREVGLLVSRAREMSIFDLVDCVGRRQADRALRLLHQLQDDGAESFYLLAMLARQVRILIQVKELRSQGLNQHEATSRLKLHPFVVKKAWAQAQNFAMAQLEAAHQRLVDTDWAIKTGEIEEVLALDMLVVGLAEN
jgi:DNA polymerase-3 subunit delta